MGRRMLSATGLTVLLALFLGVTLAKEPVTIYGVNLQCVQRSAGYDTACLTNPFERGVASARAWTDGSVLVIEGTYQDLASPISGQPVLGVHLHHDLAMYHVDTLIQGIQNDGGTSGSFVTSVPLSLEYARMLDQGRLYLDIHTAAFPEGSLRGTLVPLYVGSVSP